MDRKEKMKSFDGWLYAHRGFHKKPDAPENSLAAFRRAVEHGYGIELDVHLLKDGTLAVLHDSALKRMTGKTGNVEDLTEKDLPVCFLGKSRETIPTFRQVLDLVNGQTPLIVELKAFGGNDAALTDRACEMLAGYRGLYCIESFSPQVVRHLARHYPDIIRGQLSMNFLKNPSGLSFPAAFIGTFLLHALVSRPDFIAYQFKDRKNPGNRFCLNVLGKKGAAWTLRSEEDLRQALQEGLWPIFERFEPDNVIS